VTSEPGGICQQRGEPLHPPEHGDVIPVNADFGSDQGRRRLDSFTGQALRTDNATPPPASM
jgi:hypothetical protein